MMSLILPRKTIKFVTKIFTIILLLLIIWIIISNDLNVNSKQMKSPGGVFKVFTATSEIEDF